MNDKEKVYMLRKELWEILRPLIQLVTNLLNPEKSEEWKKEFKRFLRKEKCWSKHIINLAVAPQLSFEVDKHETTINGKIKVEIELGPDDNLYVNGMKIILTQSCSKFKGMCIQRYEHHKELKNEGQILLNSNVLDYLLNHCELVPEHWRPDSNGIRRIWFLGTIFRYSSGSLGALCLSFSNGLLMRGLGTLSDDWNTQDCLASLELTDTFEAVV